MNNTEEKAIVELAEEFSGARDGIKQQLFDLQQIVAKGVKADGAWNGHEDPFTALVEEGALTALRDRQTKGVILPMKATLPMLGKSIVVVGDDASSTSDIYQGTAYRAPGLFNDPRRKLRIMDLLPRLRVASGTFEFNSLDSAYSAAADYQARQADMKEEGDLPTTLQTANIATVAHLIRVSEQVLADNPALLGQIKALFGYGVLAKLERELIVGTGGVGKIDGLINQAQNFVASSSDIGADSIAAAQTELEMRGWQAGLAILHPRDWLDMRTARDNQNRYQAGGWNMPTSPNVWNLPVVTSSNMTEGTALVLDTNQVVLLDRESLQVEMSREDRDNYSRNLITIRAELRAGLAVFANSAVLKVAV